ncbi:MAG: hypothetical protein DMG16_24960 [Acidobacteria bacterium]|nr:MAG: hypothetical protein DMG16_24960 [Acidobacteriota bacterium]
MKGNGGVALIFALLVLSFITIVGGALLTTATIDIWISDNHKTAIQSLYLAEAGIDQAREVLRTSSSTPTELLTSAAGPDGQLLTSADLATLLDGDDQPLIPSDPSLRPAGQPLLDNSGRMIGRYYVWLRNDNADGMASKTDTNDVLTLLGFGQIGTTSKVIEVTIQKGKFPSLPGTDTQTDPRLTTVSGLESLVSSLTKNATDLYNPPVGGIQAIGNYGSATNYKVAVVNGDVVLGPGSGYGILLTRGTVKVVGNFTWNGLILIIGQGILTWNSGTAGTIYGGLFMAQTRAADGSILPTLGNVAADLTPAAIFYDAAAITAASRSFPYNPIAVKER